MNKFRQISVLCALLFVLCSCNSPFSSDTINVRLAPNYNEDWAYLALGKISIEIEKKTPTIAVLDTGYNAKQTSNLRVETVLGSNYDGRDSCDHGTQIVENLMKYASFCKIISIQITDNETQISVTNLVAGLEMAMAEEVDIIHLSIGTLHDFPEVQEKVEQAQKKQIVIIAAAGNTGGDLLFPSKYPSVISVMARDINNRDIPTNSRSETKRSYSAPGEHILCGEKYISGTSIAATYITSAVAAILASSPNATMQRIERLLQKSCQYPSIYSYGMIHFNLLSENLSK